MLTIILENAYYVLGSIVFFIIFALFAQYQTNVKRTKKTIFRRTKKFNTPSDAVNGACHGEIQVHRYFEKKYSWPIEIERWEIPKDGSEGSSHFNHDKDSECGNFSELYIVIEGKAEVKLTSDILHLNAWDSYFVEAGVPHELKNIGQSKLRVIVIYGPV